MMQEISCDDNNGESTFEFVEEKLECLSIAEDSSTTIINNGTETTGTQHSQSIEFTQSGGPITGSSVPSPTALPNFINFQQGCTATTASIPTPLTSTIPPGSAPPSLIPQFRPAAPQQMMNHPRYPFPPQNPYNQPDQNYPRVPGPTSMVTSVPQTYQGISIETSVVQSQPIQMFSPSQTGSTSVSVPFGDYQTSTMSYYSDDVDNKGLFGWIKDTMPGSDFISKFAEKAKNSVDSMITTLDPQMKEYIHSGGDIDILVAAGDDGEVSAVREAFQTVFGRATVRGIMSQNPLAPQLVGFSAGLRSAEERTQQVRQSGYLREHQPIVAVDHFVAELTPDRWYELACLILHDSYRSLTLHAFTQPIAIPSAAIQKMQDETPSDYPLRWSGLSITLGSVLSHIFQVPHNEWQETLIGINSNQLVLVGAKSLATQYKMHLCNRL